jgi:hypothetical protein
VETDSGEMASLFTCCSDERRRYVGKQRTHARLARAGYGSRTNSTPGFPESNIAVVGARHKNHSARHDVDKDKS